MATLTFDEDDVDHDRGIEVVADNGRRYVIHEDDPPLESIQVDWGTPKPMAPYIKEFYLQQVAEAAKLADRLEKMLAESDAKAGTTVTIPVRHRKEN